MKRLSFLFLFLTIAFSTLAGDYDFSGLQGLKGKNGDIWFEISGYDIYVTSQKGQLSDAKKIAELKKKYKIKNVQAEFSESQMEIPNKIFETQCPLEDNPDIKADAIYYLLQNAENELTIISFQTLNQRDLFLEQAFIKAFFDKTLENFISEDWTGESINFAGRTIRLGNACDWKNPHNFYCKGGQISWSEFSSADAAELDLEARIIANNRTSYSILANDDVDVLFEDIPTVAYRVVYKSKDDYYPLIVYYICQEVRGRYISCILSNYGYNRNDCGLSLLLQNFMSIPELPDWANNEFDVPEYEVLSEEEKEGLKSKQINIDISTGTLVPLGNLRHVYGLAPTINIFVGIPIRQKMTIDLGFFVGFPLHSQRFDFRYAGNTNKTKASTIPNLNLRYRYTDHLTGKWSYSLYAGGGFSSIITNLLKSVDEDGNETYHKVNAPVLLGGIQLTRKHWGYFVEYHHASYNLSKKVANDFGNSFLNIGLTYNFSY
ncbi:MAG: hypothetical protein LBO74_06130 [Candidatus Symbiothrix sp.]|jgi:hypothetical protein|nr:hypothetical protein [Candidatus Symbiothrix sp.]